MLTNKHTQGYWVYEHVFPDGSIYIGMSKAKSPSIRWKNGQGYEKCAKLQKKLETYKWSSATHTVLQDGLNQIEAETLEGKLIAKAFSDGAEVLNKNKRTIYNETTGEFYYCLKEAAAALNLSIGHINNVLKGRKQTANGCIIRYATEEDFRKYWRD